MHRVLLVEDSLTQSAVIRIQLKQAGFDADVAADGRQALRAIEAALPDLVLTDLHMPELNGAELAAEVRRGFPRLPVVITTAAGGEELATRALKNGAVSFVPKAALPGDLRPTLSRILEIASAGPDAARLAPYMSGGSYSLPPDPSLILPLVGHVKEELTRRALADETGVLQIAIALACALDDAMSLGSPSGPIQLSTNVALAKAVFTLRHEGLADLLALSLPPDLDSTAARAAFLLRTFFDEAAYDAARRELTLIKRRVFEES